MKNEAKIGVKIELDACLHIFKELGVRSFFVKSDFSNVSLSDKRMKKSLFNGQGYASFVAAVKRARQRLGRVVFYSDAFGISNAIAHVPDDFAPTEKDLPVIAFGPFLDDNFSFERLIQTRRCPDNALPFVKQFTESMPVIPEPLGLSRALPRIFSRIFKINFSVATISADTDEKFNAVTEFEAQSVIDLEKRYEYENAFLDAIESGEEKSALQRFDKFSNMRGMQRRTQSMLRNRQNYTIILNSLMRKACERGGVHPLYVDYLSTRFAMEINRASSIAFLVNLARRMVSEYARLVRERSMQGVSKTVREITRYIDFHCGEPLALSFFAEKFNMSAPYLSKLFHNETGMTLTDFVRKVRLEKSRTLLMTSTLALEEVAYDVGYENVNYFIRLFKSAYGITPKQFQKQARAPRKNSRAGH